MPLCQRAKNEIKKKNWGEPACVAHACNPSYSGGRGQEDHGSKPAQENNSRDPILKNPSLTQGVGPEFKSQDHKTQSKQTG
jgi:hypothetical protein